MLCPRIIEGAGNHLGGPFIRRLIPFVRALPSCPKHIPKDFIIPSHWVLGFQHTNLRGIQTFRPQHHVKEFEPRSENVWAPIRGLSQSDIQICTSKHSVNSCIETHKSKIGRPVGKFLQQSEWEVTQMNSGKVKKRQSMARSDYSSRGGAEGS